jgi:hypothetical protein
MSTPVRRPSICVPRLPKPADWPQLAKQALDVNPENIRPGIDVDNLPPIEDGKLSLDIGLRWPKAGVRLTVRFEDAPEAALRRKILLYMNKWSAGGNVEFVESNTDPDVRIARRPGDGHWSWLGIDIRNHPGEPTMNLDSFTMETPDEEFDRVVCHEAGHTLGFPHEHLRAELVETLDVEKTVAYFLRTQGWKREETMFQVLTPLESGSLLRTPRPDQRSIMCYDIPGECTKSGRPIIGGTHINDSDLAFIAKVYRKPTVGP